ncbi:MAG: cytochrome c3 family protein [Acidobacteriota bacterium]
MAARKALSQIFVALLAVLPVTSAGAGVEKTPHNLIAGRGVSPGEGEPPGVCVFCHTPHSARPTRALWNRSLPGVTYKLYESITLEADVKQPTGISRLCLSCHDGTIALGGPRVSRRRGKLLSEALTGRSSLGIDLSDDHPISFTYDSAAATRNEELADPSLLPRVIKLERKKELQCTACHDPHEDRLSKFLVMENRFSKLCVSCHRMRNWSASAHTLSPATWDGRGVDPWPHTEFGTVAENACENCHRSHSAGRPQWLLHFDEEEKNCLVCHNGTVALKNLEVEFQKFSAHPIGQTEWIHSPKEDPLLAQRHVTCNDCHDPHAVESAKGNPPSLPGALRGVRGINASGTRVTEASFEYEICYTCHGLAEQPRAAAHREDPVTNTRLEFDPRNPSYHPVVAPGKNPDVAGLKEGHTPSSLISCTDCHSSDGSDALVAPRGPHGSIYEPILEREYQLTDPSPESVQSYALCYKCHDRAVLLSDWNGFPHRLHVADSQTSCAVCHDAHGSRGNAHLINFMLRDKTGNIVVSPSSMGAMEFQDLGRSAGQCFLTCHGSDHNPKSY